MIVVADTSPLVALINIGEIELLPRLFGTVLVPPAVVEELLRPARPAAVQAWAARPAPWLHVRTPMLTPNIPDLHAGEAAAITLAEEVVADLLLIDEAHGRRVARARKLRITGTVGLLELAAEDGLVDLESAFTRLRATDFWVSPSLLDARLRQFRARRP
jgi:predicted nucleic acid-binding protein